MIYDLEHIRADVKRSADVAVIGSGAGGGPIAKELAEAGHSVVVLEEGAYFTREDFNLDPVDSLVKMYRDAGQTMALGIPSILLPLGKTVGGTTTINSGTALRILPAILKKWHLAHGLTDLTEDELNLLCAHLEEYLSVKRADPEVAGKVAQTFMLGAERLGLSAGWLPRNSKDCEGYGSCVFGCPNDSKQSVNVTFIPDAVRGGADIYTYCRAEKIKLENGRATGVRGVFVDPSSGKRRKTAIDVDAGAVVLAAGAVYSPYLLLRQGICNSSRQVGRNLQIHPAVQTAALFDEPLNPPKGIPQACYVDDFKDEGIMLEGGTVPPEIHALALPFAGKKHVRLMARYPEMGIFGGMISDTDSSGRVVDLPRAGSRPTMFYALRSKEAEKAKFAVHLMAEIWFAAGARKVITPIAGHYELCGLRDLIGLETARVRARDFYAMTAYHPLGTCRMGDDPAWSVVKPTCESWDVENLYICDGSVLPSSPGVNPQLTIMALAIRCAGFIDERLLSGKAR